MVYLEFINIVKINPGVVFMIDEIRQYIIENYPLLPGIFVMIYCLRYRIKVGEGYWGHDLTTKGYYILICGIILVFIGNFVKYYLINK